MFVCQSVNLFVFTNKLGLLSHMIHILNRRDPRSDSARNSFALTVCWKVTLWRKFGIEESEVRSSRSDRHAIKAEISGN